MTMSLRSYAEQYLAMRRSLGFKLTRFGQDLLNFITYLEAHQATVITTDLAVAWAKATPRSTSEIRWSRRMLVARIFARHMAIFDSATEVPPADILSAYYSRTTPHLYTDEQVTDLMAATRCLRPELRRRTYQTVIGLLSVTGLRTGELRRLNTADVDLAGGVILIKDTKFGKSRDVALHSSTTTALTEYIHDRDRLRISTTTPALFISGRGTRLSASDLDQTFGRLRQATGIITTGSRPPRLHDFRHTFATATLLDWYRSGADVQASLPLLSTYLGHVDPKSTYWYLTGTPELLELAADRISGVIAGGHHD